MSIIVYVILGVVVLFSCIFYATFKCFVEEDLENTTQYQQQKGSAVKLGSFAGDTEFVDFNKDAEENFTMVEEGENS